MSRIPDDEVARLKREVSLAELCRARGVELAPHGKDLIGRCPFHDDRSPSFVVTPSKNLWNCLGACGKGGSNVDFIMKIEKTDFRGAIEVLRRHRGVAPVATLKTRAGTERAILVDPSRAGDDADLLAETAEFYHQTFMNKPQAMQYLQARNCFHPEAATRFRLGFSNRLLGYRVPAGTAEGNKLKERLQKIGVMRESGHEHLSGCVVVPILGGEGRVLGMYGRRITATCRNAAEHLYLPGPHAGVWNADELKASRAWLLCEAAMDALSFWSHGHRNVTWSYGVNGFTPDHWTLVRAVRPERIILCYDNDEAGNKAANELAQQLEPEGIEAWRVELAPRSDINDLVRRQKDGKGALASLLAAAVRMLPVAAPRAKPVIVALPASEPGTEAQTGAAKKETLPPVEKPSGDSAASAWRVSEDGKQAELVSGERHWRVRGLEGNTSFDHLKVNLRLLHRNGTGERFHLDTLDLYNARSRSAFAAAASDITGADKTAIESDLAQLITRLEAHQERRILSLMKPAEARPAMTGEEESRALALLREPKLFERILADFQTAGTVGEDMNKLAGYLVTVSRKLEKPLSAMVVARSAAGKSALLNAVLDFVPEEDKQVVTSMTGQALYYMAEDALKHKVLAVMEDEGSQQATYPLKVLQSEKKLILAVTVRDPDGGMPETKMKTVEGPVAELMTSTKSELNYELENRHLILSVDEERDQTRRIHAAQRQARTLQGLLRKLDREEVLRTHHNAQRLLRPLRVVNPYAERLTFADDRLRLRRDHDKYLGLIETIAFLRQYQKPVRSCEHRGQAVQYIEADAEDLRLAHGLATHMLGRSLDELAPPTRSFLMALHAMVREQAKARSVRPEKIRFTRREVRERLKWSVTQVREHMGKLLELEYVLCHRVPGLASRFVYELLYDGEGSQGLPFMMGLSDPNGLDVGSDVTNVGRNGTHDG